MIPDFLRLNSLNRSFNSYRFMAKQLDIENWARKEHFHFFRNFEEPFFGFTTEVDCTEAYTSCRKNNISFFLYYLYLSLKAANEMECFHYRIKGENVLIHERIDASPTINRPDGTFGFSYIHYHEDFEQFVLDANKEIERVRKGKGLFPALSGENVIHYSAIPWIRFTSMSHARSFSHQDSCPKITMGKMCEVNQRKVMPVSVHAHHALVDGADIGAYLERYQYLLRHGLND